MVVQTAFLGDAILATPLLTAIKRKFPRSKLALVCRKGVGEFFLKTGLADEIFEINKNDPASMAQTFSAGRAFKPDLILSPHQSFRTALFVWSCRAPYSIGFKNFWNFWAFKKTISRDMKLHDALRQLSLMQSLESLGETVSLQDPEILFPHISPSKLIQGTDSKFTEIKGAVALAPGSQWATKRWALSGFIGCAREYLKHGEKVVLVGSPDEILIANEIIKEIPEAISLVGKTSVTELAQVLSQCRLLITNDSGAMHVATVMGTPVVSVFGPTVPSQGYSPWSLQSSIVQTDLDCRPCGAHGHERCPLGHHNCMKFVTSEMVIAAANKLPMKVVGD